MLSFIFIHVSIKSTTLTIVSNATLTTFKGGQTNPPKFKAPDTAVVNTLIPSSASPLCKLVPA